MNQSIVLESKIFLWLAVLHHFNSIYEKWNLIISFVNISLLHRPLFIKFSLLTTKQIISPASNTREKRTRTFFLRRRGSRIGAVLVLNGQMTWHVILILRIILISKRGYRSRLCEHGNVSLAHHLRTYRMERVNRFCHGHAWSIYLPIF